jgi:pimeloyl-ACP methyl ester carboxylesterase
MPAMSVLSAITTNSRPPLWREARVGLEVAALMRDPILRGEGLGDGRGRPALLIPGFMAGDGSLALMGDWLRRAGYRPSRAGMLVNVGCAGAEHERLERRLERLVAEQGQRAVVIGQSRGGSMAKVMAVRRPDLVCGLVTLGSPHVDPLAVHPLVRLHVEAVSRLGSLGAPKLFTRSCLDGECCASFWQDLAEPLAPGVGFVAVYSRSDGIVDWHACLDPCADEQVEIGASHCGMAVSPAAWRAVAKALDRFRRAEARGQPAKRQRVRSLRRAA